MMSCERWVLSFGCCVRVLRNIKKVVEIIQRNRIIYDVKKKNMCGGYCSSFVQSD